MESLQAQVDILIRSGIKPVVLGVLGLTVLWATVGTVVTWARLRHVPGPFLASVSYLWGLRAMNSGRIHHIIQHEQKKYGRIMRIGPDAVCIYEPEPLWHMNSARSPYTRGLWYKAIRFDYRGDTVITELDTATHDRRKAKLAAGYAGRGLLSLEVNIDAGIRALVQHVRAKITRGDIIMDIGKLLQYFQVDLITKAGMGVSWNDLGDEADHYDYLKTTDKTIAFAHTIAWSPVTIAIFSSKFFLRLFAPKTTDNVGMGKFMQLLKDRVQERFQAGAEMKGKEDTMLDEWIKHGLSAEECQLDMSLQIPAGTETSISSIRGIMLLLLTSPNVYARVKQEIVAAILAGRMSDPITNEEAKALPYTQAVILEGLRIMPPVTVGFPKRVPAGGDTICGVFLPAGTDVYQNYATMLRNPAVFGPDAELFRPERLLATDDPAAVAHMKKTIDLTFGFGRFSCLGKVLAQIEMNKIFVELLRNFDFQLTNPEKAWTRKSYSTYMIDDFHAVVTEGKVA